MEKLHLKLFVSGDNSCSQRAMEAVRVLCEEREGTELRIVDVLQDPQFAEEQRVIATPTLELQTETVCRRVIGDFSDAGILAARLGLPPSRNGVPG